MKNYTIIVPEELNFLVFLNNVHQQKRFPHIDFFPVDYFHPEFETRIVQVWNACLEEMFIDGNHIQRGWEYYKKHLRSLFVAYDNNQPLDRLFQYFESWWFHQAPRGNQYLLEALFWGTISYQELDYKMKKEAAHKLFVVFDTPPKGCRTIDDSKKILIKSIDYFLE
ncbi:hypothetical protein [Gracilibacillus timonensis]|uniref:hypothetical protein n=1 Tax=Gracilibacillus timonensis TaxID=1816696 RepID=UPI0008264FAD|nr:hypothetical protein [Gracilibacillus timonensis]